MRLQEEDARRGVSAEPHAPAGGGLLTKAGGFFVKTLTIAELEVRKLRHDFTELVTRAVQPVL